MKYFKKIKKGELGYLSYQTKFTTIKTIIFFLIPLSLFFAGWYTTGNRNNLLTIVAVLGLLPASRVLVTLIMFWKAKRCSKEHAAMINTHIGSLPVLYEMIFTTRETSYNIDCMVIKGHVICGFVTDSKLKEANFEQWLEEQLLQNGYKKFNVKIFKEITKFTLRIDQLNELDVEQSKQFSEVIDFLDGISL